MKNATILFFCRDARFYVRYSFMSVIPSIAAYGGYVSDIRYGKHSYETRTRLENRRKRIAEEQKEFSKARFNTPAYFHPIYAKRNFSYARLGGTHGMPIGYQCF
jgi:hypothetical protein